MAKALRIGVVGCGNIAGPYAECLKHYPELVMAGCADPAPGRAAEYAAKWGGTAFSSPEALIGSPEVDAVLNLTPYTLHAAVNRQVLAAGKHVHSEKPIALTHADAKALVELAASKGLRLSCSPVTLMGEAEQTVWKHLRSGALGTARVAYAEMNHGRIESWHPAPHAFYQAGPLYDIGVYPLSLLTAWFGPATSVRAFTRLLLKDRVTKDGAPFTASAPDFVTLVLEHATGVVSRVTLNFYVERGNTRQMASLEVHGDGGSVWLENCFNAGSRIEAAALRGEWAQVPLVRESPVPGWVDWARGLKDLHDALAEGRPHRASAEHAAHIVEILNGAESSAAADGRSVALTSAFPAPPPMPWAG